MLILGISALDKDSTLTLFEDHHLLYAVSEERLSRVKYQDGFPWKAFEDMCTATKISPHEIDIIAYPFLSAFDEMRATSSCALRIFRQILTSTNLSKSQKLSSILGYVLSLRGNYQVHHYADLWLQEGLTHYGLMDKLRRYPHELCHVAATYYASGFDQALIAISDWYGTASSGGIFVGENGSIKQLINYDWPNSLGSYYARYTEALGFMPDRHEGKVLGLSARGDASSCYLDFLREFTILEDGRFLHSHCLYNNANKCVGERSDIAAALQHTFETVLLSSIDIQRRRTGLTRICLAGGSMANVKLNQRISELENIDEVFVFPAMADGGSGYGAACLAIKEKLSTVPTFNNVYLSRDFTEDEVLSSLKDSNCQFTICNDIDDKVAHLLSLGKIVGRWNGRMEFGPRALGNRSILANPRDPAVSARLNSLLKRNDFMPFAPSMTEEQAEIWFPVLQKVYKSSLYMTITFDVPPELAKLIPSAVHIDQTARIQVVSQKLNPSFHRIIDNFYRLTETPAILNTSFNIHEDPIVYTPRDAINCFRSAELDYLALGRYLVEK